MGEERAIDWDGLRLKPAPGPAALVQGFVNTANVMHGYDLLGDVDGANEWLGGHGLLDGGPGLDEAGRVEVVAFREGLRGLLLSHNGGEAGDGAGRLNELAEDALLRVRFDGEGSPELLAAGSGGAAGGVAARLLVAVLGASSGGPGGGSRRAATGVPVGFLRRFQEPFWELVHDGRVRFEGQDARLQAAQVPVAGPAGNARWLKLCVWVTRRTTRSRW